ncbi:hypothetical protein GF406_04900 [candidate division KSB1 bacterium]|nr:hypothetical protein [candidate division KSB1 bacterium]
MNDKNLFLFILLWAIPVFAQSSVQIMVPSDTSPRVQFGVDHVISALKELNFNVSLPTDNPLVTNRPVIHIQLKDTDGLELGQEGYHIYTAGRSILIEGKDDSGILYGCLEVADRIKTGGKLPDTLDIKDQPSMVLRGTVIGMQKTEILAGRDMYEYPYTPELFPFFYEKSFWRDYLDMMVIHRLNTLYLWNGHPFASLVKLEDYPYAIEVSDEVFAKNVEMFDFITTEADKRGIWVIQMFYNIFVSQPFAERHNIATQHRVATPLVSDYNRKSIAAFVENYPNVGLLVCLGEALRDLDHQIDWFTNVIIPGVQDRVQRLGKDIEPPIVLRAHATDPKAVMEASLPLYKNLYTMAKYNGESLTTSQPRGTWRQIHLDMSRLGSQHIVNVHILANLEPFRYGAQHFIQQCVQAMKERLGAQGLHLYPLFYWDWPYSPDKVEPRLLQYERDWMWFESWARYAWDPYRNEETERDFWIQRLAREFGNKQAGKQILDALNQAGKCAPILLRRFGITEGNRQTFSLGMTLDQLVNPAPYKPYKELWLSQAPPGERLQEYVEKEWNNQPHNGETPPVTIRTADSLSLAAVNSIRQAERFVSQNKAEFLRLKNDILCIRSLSLSYAAKVRAAMSVLRYEYSNELSDLRTAEEHLAESLDHFRELAQLTRDSYVMAQSLLTYHRRIPFPGAEDGVPVNFHWTQVLPNYEKEFTDFQGRVKRIKAGNKSP